MTRPLSTGPSAALVLLPHVADVRTRAYSGDPCGGCGRLTCVEAGAGRQCATCGWDSAPRAPIDPALLRRLPGPRL